MRLDYNRPLDIIKVEYQTKIPLKETTEVYDGTFIDWDNDGYAVPMEHKPNRIFAGIASKYQHNKEITIDVGAIFFWSNSNAIIEHNGKIVYGIDNFNLTIEPKDPNVKEPIGRIIRSSPEAGWWIKLH